MLSLQETPWLLRARDRHLLNRKLSFFNKARRVTLLSWKRRIDGALVLAEKNVREVGNDIEQYFGMVKIKDVSRTRRVDGNKTSTQTLGDVAKLTRSDVVMQNNAEYEAGLRERHKKQTELCDFFLCKHKPLLP